MRNDTMTTPDQLLQLTRELVASPHFSYQPQMRLRNGAIVLDVNSEFYMLTLYHPEDSSCCGVCSTSWKHCPYDPDELLPDLEDDATVGVLRGMALRVFSCSVMASAVLTITGLVADGESWARVLISADKFKSAP